MPRGFHVLIAAQFCSALADNALLVVAIALLQQMQLAPWWAPLLKLAFTLAYVLLAPLVGPLADAVPKARLMAWANGVKMLGTLLLALGAHPVAAFALVGLGAAAYAPAKYGLITEIVPAHRLVAANGWIEVSVVCAALFGVVCGGVLVSHEWLGSALVASVGDALGGAPLVVSLATLLLVYGAAALLNGAVPASGARYAAPRWSPRALTREFARAQRTLWRDAEGGLSLAATTLFWGVGATLQFVVLRWAVEALGLTLDRAAYLQGAVALGVIAGAALAGRFVPLAAAPHMLFFGVVLGLAMPLLAWVDSVAVAIPLLVLAGAAGGLLVVPLNALLQHRGATLLGAGQSIAVQGFNENASVLAMLAGYTALVAGGVPLQWLMSGFGLAIAGFVTLLMRRARQRPPAARASRSPA